MITLPKTNETLARVDLGRLCRRPIPVGERSVTYSSFRENPVRVIARFAVTGDLEVYRRTV